MLETAKNTENHGHMTVALQTVVNANWWSTSQMQPEGGVYGCRNFESRLELALGRSVVISNSR